MAIPSLAMIPTGFKDGKLYSVLPESGVGDFTVTRGSGATRVNKDGLIEDVRILSGELVTNGSFDTDTDWIISGDNLSISNGKGISTGSNYGAQFKQTILTTNKVYKLTLDIVDYTSGAISLMAVYYGEQNTFSSVGTHTTIFTSLNQTELRLYSEDFIGSIDNVSVKEITEDTDIPRLDYTDGGCPVLLTEPQSTNLIAYSEEFSNSYWTKSGASVISGFSSPSADYTDSAYKVVNNSSVGSHHIKRATGINVLNGATYTYSIFLKKGTKDIITIEDGAQVFGLASFNLTLKTATNLSGTNAKIEEFSDGWFRCSVSRLSNSTSLRFTIYSGTTSSGIDTSGDFYIYGAQLEALPYSTSYIPTSGAIATRLADTLTGAGDSSTFNSAEGVLYLEIAALANPVSSPLNITLSDGTTSNYVRVELYQDGKVYGNIYDGTSVAGSFAINQSNYNKVALQYSASGSKLYVNGIGVDFASKVFSASTLNSLQFSHANSSTSPFYGKTKDLRVYNTALTDLELTELTTI